MADLPAGQRITYQLQYRKCGKGNCCCKHSQRRGPYWYAFWREGARLRSCSIGKKRSDWKEDDTKEEPSLLSALP